MASCKDCVCSEVCYYKAFNDEKHLKKRRNDVEKICKSFVHRDSIIKKPTELLETEKRRMIDADAFRDFWNKNYRHQYANDTFLFALANFPTVDAVEVVHGRCEYCKDGKSFIGARMLLGNDGKWHDINNCPNCGAKMDGDGK